MLKYLLLFVLQNLISHNGTKNRVFPIIAPQKIIAPKNQVIAYN